MITSSRFQPLLSLDRGHASNSRCPLVLSENTGIGPELSWHRPPPPHESTWRVSLYVNQVYLALLSYVPFFLLHKESKGFCVTLIPLLGQFLYSQGFFLDHLTMPWLLSRTANALPPQPGLRPSCFHQHAVQKWFRILLEFASWGLSFILNFLKLFWKSLEK